jgi:ribonucleoside-diphosphate reductase alpha chain
VAPGRPGPHGPAGRVLQAEAAVRLARGRALSARISEEIYFNALWASCELAESRVRTNFAETRAAKGELQFDLWGVTPSDPERWDALRDRIAEHGLRNSLLIAIAPTATIASIAGCYECIEPQVSNLFKRETLSGEFLQINAYLVRDLQSLGLWNDRSSPPSRRPRARSRTSRRSPPSCGRSTAPPGSCRCGR